MTEEPLPIICRVWTDARNHEKVTGSIGGTRIPISTDAQMVATPLSAVVLLALRKYWSFLPIPAQVVLVLAVPAAVWLTLRYWKPDDRSAHGYLAGLLSYAIRPRQGRRHGRPVRIPAGRRAGSPFFFSGS